MNKQNYFYNHNIDNKPDLNMNKKILIHFTAGRFKILKAMKYVIPSCITPADSNNHSL